MTNSGRIGRDERGSTMARWARLGAAGLIALAGAAASSWAQADAEPAGTATSGTQAETVSGFSEHAGPRYVESLGAGITRFFASSAARSAAHPSYALLRDGPGQVVAEGGRVVPRFGTIEGREAVIVSIEPGTSLYGTGEVPGPLLRNGRRTTLWNTDAYGYGDETKSLYQSHPWVLAVRADGSAYGILADSTYRMDIDTAATDAGQVRFVADGPSFPVVVIEGSTPQEVVRGLGALTGLMPMPPKWAIGYHQCRYSYYPESRVREIAREFRSRQIPCDVLWFDIDYMAGFRVFTFNRELFPDPKGLNADLKAQGFHNVWMINPGIKARDEASSNDPTPEQQAAWSPELRSAMEAEWARFRAVREDGTKNDVWTKRADGTTYEGEVWPSWCFFPDFTAPRVQTWWGPWHEAFMAQGITGVWNDMNEPAIFNVPSKTMPEDNVHAGDPEMVGPTGEPQGAERARGTHARYHNVFGMQMIKATREAIAKARPEHRPFVLSRANFIGGQRYGATWTGDNTANWYHVEVSVPMVLNLGLSGNPFTGPDIGGFVGNGDGPMFARWMGFGTLLPFARGHTGKGNVDKEPWSFGPAVESTSREALNRRYRLLPYFYTVFEEASQTGLPVARPVFFADPKDLALRSEDDAFLIGDSLLVEPQLVPDRSRVTARPQGIWREVLTSNDPDLPRLLVRGGSIVPMGPLVQFVGEKPLDPLELVVVLDGAGRATGTLYEDAGDGYGYRRGEFLRTTYEAFIEGSDVVVRVKGTEGSMPRPTRQVEVRILLDPSKHAAVDGSPIVAVGAVGRDGEVIRVPMGP